MNERVRGLLPMRRIVNIFGAVGYSLLLVAYAIIIGVALLWLLRGGHLTAIGVTPEAVPPPAPTSPPVTPAAAPSLAVTVVMYAVTALMGLMVLFVAITLPYWLGRSGSYLLKRLIRLCQWPVTLGSLLITKLAACSLGAVPVVLSGLSRTGELSVMLGQLLLLGLALVVFLIQHYLARMSEVIVAKDVW